MLRKSGKKNVTLSDKIADIFAVPPKLDIEDDLVFNSKPKTVQKDDLDSDNDDAVLSNFRKQNVALLADISDKYAGKVVSKNNDLSESDEDEDTRNDESYQESSVSDHSIEVDDEASSENDEDSLRLQIYESSEEGDESENDNFEDNDEIDLSKSNEKNDGSFKHIQEADVLEENNKGNCVRNQLKLWENFLELRINLQKCLASANRMPPSDVFLKLKKDDGNFVNTIGKTKSNIINLLDKLLNIQSYLFLQYPETKSILKKNDFTDDTDTKVDDEEIPSDSEELNVDENIENEKPKQGKKRKYEDFSKDLGEHHKIYSKYRNSVIQKWYEKTTIHKKNQGPSTSILSQIEYLLSDKDRLIKKTQVKRSDYEIIGLNNESNSISSSEASNGEHVKNNEVYNKEIFDDDDFYHQLLRELIEHKSADISDPIQLSRQWITLQQMRSKMKRKIDTKATKGRRIRYIVHSKLVNFMAPQRNLNWTDESKNELFASLFGKQFES